MFTCVLPNDLRRHAAQETSYPRPQLWRLRLPPSKTLDQAVPRIRRGAFSKFQPSFSRDFSFGALCLIFSGSLVKDSNAPDCPTVLHPPLVRVLYPVQDLRPTAGSGTVSIDKMVACSSTDIQIGSDRQCMCTRRGLFYLCLDVLFPSAVV